MTAPTIADYQPRLVTLASLAHAPRVTIDGRPVGEVAPGRLLTIGTTAFNAAKTIEETIRSVLGQTYRDIEYVIADGGSTDDTVDIVRRYENQISWWHSARDSGISDGFNLCVAAARGSAVGLVNADDWMSPDQAGLAMAALERTGADWVFGRLAFHRSDGTVACMVDGDPHYARRLRHMMPELNHPSMVVRRTAYEAAGLFDPRWRIAMDYDWLLRAARWGLRGVYDPELLGHIREGGVSDHQVVNGMREVRSASIAQGESALMAHGWYALRRARGLTRTAMRRVLPLTWVDAVHRTVNPNYNPVVPGGR